MGDRLYRYTCACMYVVLSDSSAVVSLSVILFQGNFCSEFEFIVSFSGLYKLALHVAIHVVCTMQIVCPSHFIQCEFGHVLYHVQCRIFRLNVEIHWLSSVPQRTQTGTKLGVPTV